MPGVFTKRKAVAVTFCERCAEVCDDGFRRAALRKRALLQQLWLGVRV
jgi:hypothetical protein